MLDFKPVSMSKRLVICAEIELQHGLDKMAKNRMLVGHGCDIDHHKPLDSRLGWSSEAAMQAFPPILCPPDKRFLNPGGQADGPNRWPWPYKSSHPTRARSHDCGHR